jgi:SNF2 family DNA or RNA helicase
MLKKTDNKLFQLLLKIKTPRRILLSGSPFQNNLFEYFRMVNYARPGAVGGIEKETDFDRLYADPIMRGMASDAGPEAVLAHLTKTKELNEVLAPIVHRKDASELRKELPPMQQVVLHVRQSRIQSRLYTAYKRLQKDDDTGTNYQNFFQMYTDLVSLCLFDVFKPLAIFLT